MSELRPDHPPTRTELLRSIGARLHLVVPGYRWIASDLLADRSRIDLLGADAEGHAVLALVGEREEDALLLLGRLLAQRSWIQQRLADWLKLAPQLPVNPQRPVQGLVLCPAFGSEARAAADALPPGSVRLVDWRYVRNGSGSDVLLEPSDRRGPPPSPRVPGSPSGGSNPLAGFRTGLTEQDLGLSDAERAEFD